MIFVRGLILAWLLVGSQCAAQALTAGAAKSNITPAIGEDIVGGFLPIPSTYIHDDLFAKCVVLDNDETRIALVVCDLLGIARIVSEKARELIHERYEIPPSHVLICATHTHSAASALGKNARKLDQPADAYQGFVARRVADAVGRAIHHMRPAEFAFGQVDVPAHVFNRRWHMRPGTVPTNPFGGLDMVKMNPPRANPNLVEPAGPVDPTVSYFFVRNARTGRPISLFASYSLHYVGGVGSGHVSADYFAEFGNKIDELFADDLRRSPPDEALPFVAMLANGTSGDINNINFREPRPRRKPYEQIRAVGHDVAQKVYASMANLEFADAVELKAIYREPSIAWRRPSDGMRNWAEQTIAAGKQQERDLSYIYAQRTMAMVDYPNTTTVPLQAFRIGRICLATMPFEVFSEIGLDFKSNSVVQPAFLVSLTHGYFGYLPTPRQHRLGGYETWLGTNRVEPKASEVLLKHLVEMSSELR